jgi:hypothetical protein
VSFSSRPFFFCSVFLLFEFFSRRGFWPGAPLCFVDFKHFARFAELWFYQGSGLPADLDGNTLVDLYDLKLFTDVWLCSCSYNWPLK